MNTTDSQPLTCTANELPTRIGATWEPPFCNYHTSGDQPPPEPVPEAATPRTDALRAVTDPFVACLRAHALIERELTAATIRANNAEVETGLQRSIAGRLLEERDHARTRNMELRETATRLEEEREEILDALFGGTRPAGYRPDIAVAVRARQAVHEKFRQHAEARGAEDRAMLAKYLPP